MSQPENWRDWRREVDGLTWRVALPSDLPAIERIWRAKHMVLGVKCRMPDLFASPVVLTLVAEDDHGRVVDGAFFEAVIDCTKLGARPGGFRALTAISDELAGFFKSRKFRRVTAAMPKRISDKMSDGLKSAGFEPQQLSLWERNL